MGREMAIKHHADISDQESALICYLNAFAIELDQPIIPKEGESVDFS